MKNLENMKIKKMLLIGFGSIILLSSIIIICAIVSINFVSGNIKNMYNQPYQASNTMWEIRTEIISVERMLYKGIAALNDTERKQAVQSNQESSDKIMNDLNKLGTFLLSEDEEVLLEDIKTLLEQGGSIRIRINEFILANDEVQAFSLIKEEYTPIFDQVVKKVLELSSIVSTDAQGFVDDSTASSNLVIITIVVVLIFSILFSSYITTKITRVITRPITMIMNSIQAVSEGNLSIGVSYESNNELGVLAECTRNTIGELKKYIQAITYSLQCLAKKDMTVKFDTQFKGEFIPIQESTVEIIEFLNGMIHRTKKAVNEVYQASNQVKEVSQSLASEAIEEAAATQEISATVDEVTEKVEINAENAKNVSEIAGKSVDNIEKGNEIMGNLVVAIKEIDNQSNQISSIIQVINDIASQTNMLALNASIEAARAGEHGKGFAVVADEIGKLASESAKAAKNIAGLINTSIKAVDHGTILASETADILKGIVSSVDKTSNLVRKISEACDSQSTSLASIVTGVNAVAEGAGNNSASAEEASAVSEKLSEQAEELRNMLAEYKLA